MDPTERKQTRCLKQGSQPKEPPQKKKKEELGLSMLRPVKSAAQRSAVPKAFQVVTTESSLIHNKREETIDTNIDEYKEMRDPFNENFLAEVERIITAQMEAEKKETSGPSSVKNQLPLTPTSPIKCPFNYTPNFPEKRIQEDRNNLAFTLPPTPDSLFDLSFNYPKIDENEDLVCRVLPIMLGYSAVKITKMLERPQIRTMDEVDEYIPQKRNRPIMEYSIATELIPFGSPYWKQIIDAVRNSKGNQSIKVKSDYDNIMIMGRMDKQGRIYAARDYKYALIVKNIHDSFRHPPRPAAKIYYERPSEIRCGKLPTEFIPIDSPYYASLMIGLRFPKTGTKWYN